MVKPGLSAVLGLLLLAQPCLSAELTTTAALSPTAAVALSTTPQPLLELPGRPEPIPKVPNQPVEDFFAVTLISLPFTALWALIGALVVGSVSQNHFPPDFSTPMLVGAASIAGGSSVAIGLVSIQWSAKAPAPTKP